jgi:hypothetical protein
MVSRMRNLRKVIQLWSLIFRKIIPSTHTSISMSLHHGQYSVQFSPSSRLGFLPPCCSLLLCGRGDAAIVPAAMFLAQIPGTFPLPEHGRFAFFCSRQAVLDFLVPFSHALNFRCGVTNLDAGSARLTPASAKLDTTLRMVPGPLSPLSSSRTSQSSTTTPSVGPPVPRQTTLFINSDVLLMSVV